MTIAAAFNKSFTILSPVDTPQTNGEIVTTYTAGASFPGMLIPIRSAEVYDIDAQTDRTVQKFQVIASYRNDITARHRLRESGLDYQVILPRDPSGRAQYTLIDVERRA